MVFSTSIFIYLFLPITLLIYYIAPKKCKNFIILLSGLVFYSWGEPIYVVVMLISTMIDYFAGLVMNTLKGKAPTQVMPYCIGCYESRTSRRVQIQRIHR